MNRAFDLRMGESHIEVYKFRTGAIPIATLLALVIPAWLPLHFTRAALLDLPVLVVIYLGLRRGSRNPRSRCTLSPPRSSAPSSPCSSLSCSTASADRPERSGARTRFAEHDATVRNISPRLDGHRPTALRDLVAWTRVSAGLGCREPNPGSLCFRSPLFLPCQKCGRPFSLERRVSPAPSAKPRQTTLRR